MIASESAAWEYAQSLTTYDRIFAVALINWLAGRRFFKPTHRELGNERMGEIEARLLQLMEPQP